MNYDIIIVGAGPAGIFTALELIRRGSKKRSSCSKRVCPSKSAAAPS